MKLKYLNKRSFQAWVPLFMVPLSFLLIELFAFVFLDTGSALARNQAVWTQFQENGYVMQDVNKANFWPVVFGIFWTAMITCILGVFPRKISIVIYGALYFLAISYAVGQTGYFLLFQEMMWLSDFRYASEGSDYASIILRYPLSWWLWIAALLLVGGITLWKYPRTKWVSFTKMKLTGVWCAVFFACAVSVFLLPKVRFHFEETERTQTDINRSESAEAAYENMFNAHRLYQICGVYQTVVKDIYANYIYPLSPAYREWKERAKEEVSLYFEQQTSKQTNAMTRLLEDKNVILVLMESIDDWMLGEHTPTLNRLMAEGINFTNFYTPVYGGIRTFNTEYCINTGSFLSSSGGYALDYVNNSLPHSLPNMLAQKDYHSLLFHYNTPDFYSRSYFSKAMGYSDYVSYSGYVDWGENEDDLYDDQLVFDNQKMSDSFFRPGKKLNFVITHSAHMPYEYSDELSQWGMAKYPQYRGLTGHEETDCAYLKAKLVDDFFARLLKELELRGGRELENTVIIAITDHYTYGYTDMESLLQLSGVEETLLLEKTPFFIWSKDLKPMTVDKVLNTSDFLPTVLNLLGMESTYDYIGRDAFDDDYEGFVPFSDGSWIAAGIAYNSSSKTYFSVDGSKPVVSEGFQTDMAQKVHDFVRINNQILKTDYYRQEQVLPF